MRSAIAGKISIKIHCLENVMKNLVKKMLVIGSAGLLSVLGMSSSAMAGDSANGTASIYIGEYASVGAIGNAFDLGTATGGIMSGTADIAVAANYPIKITFTCPALDNAGETIDVTCTVDDGGGVNFVSGTTGFTPTLTNGVYSGTHKFKLETDAPVSTTDKKAGTYTSTVTITVDAP
jgi:hypothetical protein